MSSWVKARVRRHREELQQVRREMSVSWTSNELPEIDVVVPILTETPNEKVARLQSGFPMLDPGYLEFVAQCARCPMFGFTSDDSFGIVEVDRVDHLSNADPGVIARWNSGPTTPCKTPRLVPLADQNPHDFDSRELSRALVLARGERGCDPALLWIPAPRREYWLVASWEGCLRFSNIEEAFDYMLSQSVESLRAALE